MEPATGRAPSMSDQIPHEAARLVVFAEHRPGDGRIPAIASAARFQAKLPLHLAALVEGIVDRLLEQRPVRRMHPRQRPLHAREYRRQMTLPSVHDRELKGVAGAVPAPRMHVRHVHRQLQPAGAALERGARQPLRLDALHRAERPRRAVPVRRLARRAEPFDIVTASDRRVN